MRSTDRWTFRLLMSRDDSQKPVGVFEILACGRVTDFELARIVESAPHGREQRVVDGDEVGLPLCFGEQFQQIRGGNQ